MFCKLFAFTCCAIVVVNCVRCCVVTLFGLLLMLFRDLLLYTLLRYASLWFDGLTLHLGVCSVAVC